MIELCQRSSEILGVVDALWHGGIRNIHGFGVKVKGALLFGHMLQSADSMAWSYHARRRPAMPGHTHSNCANCIVYAEKWAQEKFGAPRSRPEQLELFA